MEVRAGAGEDLESKAIRRLVFGRLEPRWVAGCLEPRWVTEEIVTCKIHRGRRRLLRCHECGKLILPPAAYYSDRIYYRSREYAGMPGWKDSARKHYHVLCYGCWKGEPLSPRGGMVKFIDRSRPPGRRVVGVKPFSSSLRKKEPARENRGGSNFGETPREPSRPSLCGAGVGSPGSPDGKDDLPERSGA